MLRQGSVGMGPGRAMSTQAVNPGLLPLPPHGRPVHTMPPPLHVVGSSLSCCSFDTARQLGMWAAPHPGQARAPRAVMIVTQCAVSEWPRNLDARPHCERSVLTFSWLRPAHLDCRHFPYRRHRGLHKRECADATSKPACLPVCLAAHGAQALQVPSARGPHFTLVAASAPVEVQHQDLDVGRKRRSWQVDDEIACQHEPVQIPKMSQELRHLHDRHAGIGIKEQGSGSTNPKAPKYAC